MFRLCVRVYVITYVRLYVHTSVRPYVRDPFRLRLRFLVEVDFTAPFIVAT